MQKIRALTDFLNEVSLQVPIIPFIINLLVAAILALILQRIYIRYGRSLSNRVSFARNFILISMTTMLVITIVKSSLALSLGLVGALSIVRFRAAIKEPEELAFIFVAIGIGLGLGADQRIITIIALVIIISVIVVYSILDRYGESEQNLFLTINSKGRKPKLDQIQEVLNTYCVASDIRRFDESSDSLEASFSIEIRNYDELLNIKSKLLAIEEGLNITFINSNVT